MNKPTYVKLIKDITDPTGDTDLFIPKDTVLYVLMWEDDIAICDLPPDTQVGIAPDEFISIEFGDGGVW